MATLYAVDKGYGNPEVCETREDAESTARWYTDHPYWAVEDTMHHPGDIEAIPAKLPNDAGIRTVYDIVDTDAGGYAMGYYPAGIGPGTHTDTAGVGPFCADCARELLPQMEEDETFWQEPEYESDFGTYCENCQKALCEPHCQLCGDVREETEQRDWYTDDSHGYLCPRCMAAARIRASKGVDVLPRGRYHDYALATSLAPGVYDTTLCEHDGGYNGRGLFYAPSCGHHVADVFDTYRAALAR